MNKNQADLPVDDRENNMVVDQDEKQPESNLRKIPVDTAWQIPIPPSQLLPMPGSSGEYLPMNESADRPSPKELSDCTQTEQAETNINTVDSKQAPAGCRDSLTDDTRSVAESEPDRGLPSLRTVQRRIAQRIPTIDGADQCKRFAVITPLVDTPEGLALLYEVRSSNLKHHAGEISFPGGAAEEGEYPLDTAVRETCEELLIEPGQVEIWGAGDMLSMPFNLILYPFIAKLTDYNGTFNKDEVDHVFTIPLKWFDDNEPIIYNNRVLNVPVAEFPYEKIPGGNRYKWATGVNPIYLYEYGEYVVWGMTGRVTATVVRLLKEAGLF